MSKKSTSPKSSLKQKVQEPQAQTTAIPTPQENIKNNIHENSLWKKLFFASLIFMLGCLWISGYDSGYCSDEMDMNIYGKANIAYYASGMKDTTFMNPSHNDGVILPPMLRYYGSAFEYIASPLCYLLGDTYEYNTRHALNQFFAVLGLLFMGLLAKKLHSYQAAMLSIWLCFLTPIFNGLAIFDTKDIPFLSAYIASIYFTIVFIEYLNQLKWYHYTGLIFSLWFLFSTRIGGLLVLGFMALYALLFYFKNHKTQQNLFKQLCIKLGLAVVVAFVFTIILWPYVLENPSQNLIKSINVVKEFPQKIVFAFEGEFIDSLQLPKHYIPKMMWITIPIIIQIFLGLGLLALIYNFRKIKFQSAHIILLLAGFVPLVIAITSQMPLYNSWRHLLFVYPPLVVTASVGFMALYQQMVPGKFQVLWLPLLWLGAFKPIQYWINNNTYQYTYYNSNAGNAEKAYLNYETDYWQISVKAAIDWLMKNEAVLNSNDSINISTNAYTFSNYYTKKRYPNAKVKWVALGEKSRYANKGTYSIFNSLFLEPTYLEYCYPSPFSIKNILINGMPCTYLGKDTAQYIYHAFEAFNANNVPLADSLFQEYSKQIHFTVGNKNLIPVYGAIAYSRYVTGHWQEAEQIAQKVVALYPQEYFGYLTLGAVNLNKKNYVEAKQNFLNALSLRPGDAFAMEYLKQIP